MRLVQDHGLIEAFNLDVVKLMRCICKYLLASSIHVDNHNNYNVISCWYMYVTNIYMYIELVDVDV